MTPLRLAVAVSGWLALAATGLPAGSPPRLLIAFTFVLLCPGAAAVRLAGAVLRRSGLSMDRLEALVLAGALSLALGALGSEAFFLTGSFTTTRAVTALAAFTSCAALCPVPEGRTERVARTVRRPR
jgi:hypothetical protein